MDGQPCPISNAQQLRVVQQLLWDVISLHLYPAERDEIRRSLGGCVLAENEALFSESGALADILGEVQLSTGALLARHQLCSNPQRSMVETEIRLLIERLHASAAVSPYGSSVVRERDPDSLLPRSGRRDRAVLEYVATVAQIAETGGRPPSAGLPPRPPSASTGPASSSPSPAATRPGTSSRPPTAPSAAAVAASLTLPTCRPGTASPTFPPQPGSSSRPSTASSAASSAATRYTDAPSIVAGVADKLNVSNFDAVRETLRVALMDERAALLEDIEYLQGLLDAEADLQVRAAAPPPTLAELKDYSSRLAAVVAGEEARVEHEVRVSAMFAAAEQHSSKPGRLRGMVDASRRPTSSGSAGAAAASAATSPRGTAASTVAARRCSGGGGGAQTLVVHGSEEDAAARATQQQRQAAPATGTSTLSLTAAAEAGGPGLVGADGAGVGGSTAAGAAPLAAVRRPGSGGTGATVGGATDGASPLPPVLLRPSALSPHPSTTGRPHPSPPSSTTAAFGHSTKAAESNGCLAAAPPPPTAAAASRPLHQPSPGRLRPAGSATATATAAASGGGGALLPPPRSPPPPPHGPAKDPQPPFHSPSQPQGPTQLHRDKSPSLRPPHSSPHVSASSLPSSLSMAWTRGLASSAPPGTATTTSRVAVPVPHAAAGASAATAPGPRPVLPLRSGSVGRTGESTSAAAASGGSSSSSIAARIEGRCSSAASVGGAAAVTGRANAAAAATAAASPGNAVAARLGGAAAALPSSAAESYGTAVQPRALLGNKQSVVERLDEEVDRVKGGLAAILERYNLRPSTPAGAAAATATLTAAAAPVVAPSPGGSRAAR